MNENHSTTPICNAGISARREGIGGAPGKIRSQALFQGRRELLIAHGDREYRLRITASGKLILTA
jgi:hemin uptake protein HemP